MSRGIDGLTIEELRTSRDCWWDDRFTRILLDAIPATAGTLVEIGCGLARAGRELLPHRTELRYVGIDVDGARLGEAGIELAAADLGRRTQLLQAAGERLPIADGAVDVVLTAMTLQHIADAGAVLGEARRVLAPRGTLVAVEPDHLAHRWYFDGLLDHITSAFAALTAERRAAKMPADLAIGPRVPSLLRHVGFREVAMRAHCVQGGGYNTAGDVAAELLNMADTLAANATAPCKDGVQAFKTAVHRWLDEIGPQKRGQFAWFVPVFVTCGRQ
jgi:SAM-dependent methyltransferase